MAGRARAEWALRLLVLALLTSVPVRTTEAGGDGGTAPKASPTPQTMGAAIKGQPFFGYGVDIELRGQPSSPLLNGVVGMQFNWVRQSVDWRQLEPSAGIYDWDQLDVAVYDVANRGLHLVLHISGIPDWGAGDDEQPSHPTSSAAGPDVWANLMTALATRYRGLVDAYQIGQVPDLSAGWNVDSVAAYVRAVEVAHQAVVSYSPGTLVVSAGVPADAGLGYLAAMYGAGLAPHCDAIAISVGEAAVGLYEEVHQVMTANGDGAKPIWLTDVGAPVAAADGVCADGTSEELQAEYLVRIVRTAEREPSIQAVMLDNYNRALVGVASEGACSSLLRSDWSARPAFLELAQMRHEKLFRGASDTAQNMYRRAPQAGLKPYMYQPEA